MYEWLIKTTEAQKGPETEVRRAIGYAASIAKRTKRPEDLVRIADMMVIRNMYGPVGDPGYETNIGELVDLAADKLPTSPYPAMMSVNLASKTKDATRMADAADRLLALGWVGPMDDKIRKDLARQVEALAKSLQDDGKTEQADTLARKVAESEVRDVYVSLKWTGEADIDLAVEEPLGAICRYQTPRTVFGGAMLKNGFGKHPEEVYVCPRGFDGDYTIRVDTIFNDEARPVQEATLTVITHEGGADEKRQEFTVNLAKPEPVVVRLDKGRRKEVLPYIPPPEAVTLNPKRGITAAATGPKPPTAKAGTTTPPPAAATKKGSKPIPVN